MSGPLPAIQLGAHLRRYGWQWRPCRPVWPLNGPSNFVCSTISSAFWTQCWTQLMLEYPRFLLWVLLREHWKHIMKANKNPKILNPTFAYLCRVGTLHIQDFVHHFGSLPWLGQRWWHSQCRPLAGLPWPQFHVRSHDDGNEDAQQEISGGW